MIFAWHINAKPEQTASAPEIGEMTIGEIQDLRD